MPLIGTSAGRTGGSTPPSALRRCAFTAPPLARRLQRFALAVLADAELDRRQQGQRREQQAEPDGRTRPRRRLP
jgi:hypothetical protein